eukprot:COSAG01_NODE_11380_length_1948_cov_3.694429_1_plen_378_part_00
MADSEGEMNAAQTKMANPLADNAASGDENDDETEPRAPKLEQDEIVCATRYNRISEDWFIRMSVLSGSCSLIFNVGLVVSGEVGHMPAYDYQLFGKAFPLAMGTIMFALVHRALILRTYIQSGALERLTDIPVTQAELSKNRKIVNFFYVVIGPSFAQLALIPTPIYVLRLAKYERDQDTALDDVVLLYGGYCINALFMAYGIFNYCTIYDQIYCWVLPKYLKKHVDVAMTTIDNALNDLAEDEDEVKAKTAIDDAIQRVRDVKGEQQNLFGTHATLISVVQSFLSLLLIPSIMAVDWSDTMSAICGLMQINLALGCSILESAQLSGACIIGDYYADSIVNFNSLKYSATEIKFFGGQPGAIYSMLKNFEDEMEVRY